jgi:hypothetical protein
MDNTHELGPGRKPPPAEYHFLKGTTGNKKGRPKGSIDIKKLTRKVANKKHAVRVDGRIVWKPLLQLVIESLVREMAAGKPSMVALNAAIRAKVCATEEQVGGFMLVPATASIEEFLAEEEARNANAQDPTTWVNHKAEEMCKAVKGIPSPLGEAILAFNKRWH